MTIGTGSRLGPYEIAARIGAGGMGEVFRARDTRIGRDVAVKVLPAALSSDAARLQRFETESRAAGTLNHPNLVTIFDVGAHDGTPYIVMELMEGETLREKLRDGRLSPRTAIDYASQMAAGLAAAHEKGIIHRDLKPENVFVTDDDRVKILDFGLAKLTQPAGANDTEAHTMARQTDPGTVLGTVGYMSPEQVRGQNVDHRSDIFSFGSILYEMLTGARPFSGLSSADTMSAILREDPPEISGTTGVTPALDRIVRHCLEKNPAARFQSARDLVFDLQNVSNLSSTGEATRIAARAPRTFSIPVVIAAVIIAAALGWLAARRFGRAASPGILRITRITSRTGNHLSARFAPDGNSIYYGAAYGTAPGETFTSRVDGSESRSLGIPNSDVMAVSPNGDVAVLLKTRYLRTTIGVGTLALVSPGGAPRPVAENVYRAAFAPDGKSMAVLRRVRGRSILEYPLGHKLLEDVQLQHMRVSRDGESVAVFKVEPGRITPIIVDRSGRAEELDAPVRRLSGFAWSASGDEIICACGDDSSTLMAIDRKGHKRVLAQYPIDIVMHDILPSGRMLIESAMARAEIGISANGKESDYSWLGSATLAGMTPDGREILFGEGSQNSSAAFLRPLDGSPAVRLGDGNPYALSPDGKSALIRDSESGRLSIVPTGAGLPRELDSGGIVAAFGTFLTPQSVLISGADAKKQQQLILIDVATGARRTVARPNARTTVMSASPDGKHVAVRSPESVPMMLSVDEGILAPIEGLDPNEYPYQWTADGKALLVWTVGEFPARISRFDLATRSRRPVVTLTTPNANGVYAIDRIASTPDGKTHVYSYFRLLTSTLYVIDGLH